MEEDKLARIELPAAELEGFVKTCAETGLVQKLKSVGYAYVTLDVEGYRTGSMNEVLAGRVRDEAVRD